jgi:short-subunit dehydrogenase
VTGLNGKVAVITGSSMGIGEAIAKRLVAEGASVVLSSRDADRAEAARLRIGHGERTLALACDVRNREEIEHLLGLTLHNFGRVDIWVNNAGFGLHDAVADLDMAATRELFETNLFGAVNGMQVVIPAMVQQRHGVIINISSVAGHIPLPFSGAYSATKFALNAMGKAARIELRGTGVHVMTVCPGYVATDFKQHVVRGRARRGLASPVQGIAADRVAEAVVLGYLKRKREVVIPRRDRIFITLYQLFPGVVEYIMARMVKENPNSK